MGLLKIAEIGTAYAKIGIMGFAGSGKTFTATELAKGLCKAENANKAAFFDTEKGSDFVISRFKADGIELMSHKGRAFKDLIEIMKEVEKEKIPVLIIDSISHVWRDLCDSYSKKYNKKSLTMYDWGILKSQWKEYTDLFINSKTHILMCGRAGFEYEQGVNEDSGKKEIIKTGTKMRVEGETGFEPDLLLEMDRVDMNDKIVNRVWVLKDRTNTMNGKNFDYPNFETFKSFFSFIQIGGKHEGVSSKDSSDLFEDRDWSVEERKKRKDIAIERLQETLIITGHDGTSKDTKEKRTNLLISIFGTSAQTFIQNLKSEDIESGINKIREMFKDKFLVKEEPTTDKVAEMKKEAQQETDVTF